jgi:hypothetical protein
MPLPAERSETPSLAAEEYRVLRETIRERGTLRLFVSAITFVAWAALAIFAPSGSLVAAFAPLVVLAGGFEIVFAIHVGVERIGRFLAVHYEPDSPTLPAWERTASRASREQAAATGVDPLFVSVFTVATLVNLLNLEWSASPATPSFFALLLTLAAHIGFLLRLVRARRFAAGQRTRDEALFRELGL